MPKTKMKFPPVPGATPRERFMNLARHIISIPKEATAMTDEEVRDAHRILKSRGFKICDKTEARFNLEERKHFSDESIQDASPEWFRARLEEKVPDGEFWFYSHYLMKPSQFQDLTSKYELSGCIPILKPVVHTLKP